MFDCYTVDRIADDCHDLYVSEDDGYTWEYYGTYEHDVDARLDGEKAVKNADSRAEYYTL
jgi:hypothetical protein